MSNSTKLVHQILNNSFAFLESPKVLWAIKCQHIIARSWHVIRSLACVSVNMNHRFLNDHNLVVSLILCVLGPSSIAVTIGQWVDVVEWGGDADVKLQPDPINQPRHRSDKAAVRNQYESTIPWTTPVVNILHTYNKVEMSHALLHWNFQRTKATMMTNILPLALLCLLFTGEISYAGITHIRKALEKFWNNHFSEEDGWVTCQDEDPFSGLTNNKKTEVKLVFFIIF